MSSMRELKGRIASVRSTQKITGAMKMISSAKLRKAESSLNHALPYLRQLRIIMSRLWDVDCEWNSPLMENRPIHRVALVAFASDEGLCGAFNVAVGKKLVEAVSELHVGTRGPVLVYPVGKKIEPVVAKRDDAEVVKVRLTRGNTVDEAAVRALADELMDKFLRQEIDRVEIIYYQFKSVGKQILTRRRLLPIKIPNPELLDHSSVCKDYIFEPDCSSIVQELFPMGIWAMLREAFLESRASEQAARILAMQMANDNALKLMKSLDLEYNKLRQQNITTELLDIMGGSMR